MGKTIDEVIEGALMHGAHPYNPAKYDPNKAHEYYLRTRDLKGRRKGEADRPSGPGRGGAKAKAETKHQISPTAQKKVAQLTARLHQLQARLRELLANKRKSSPSKKDDHKTAADKSKDARDSKKYREKHKAEIEQKAKKAAAKKSGGGGGSHGSSIGSMTEDQVRAAITKVRADLQAAVAAARR